MYQFVMVLMMIVDATVQVILDPIIDMRPRCCLERQV